MEINALMVKDLREKTGAGMMDCKKALVESKGNIDDAVDYLRKKGLSKASKKAGRAVKEGLVGSYIHQGGKIGVLLEINCETDFVAKTEDFQNLLKDVSMQIAATDPSYVKRDDIPEDVLSKEKELYRAQVMESGKPEHIADKIVEGKMEKYFGEICLLEQTFVKDPNVSIQDLVNSCIARLGENLVIRRFARFEIGK